MILGNPVMIDAYRAGIPGNGKPVPDGAKMAKVHWTPKQNEFFPPFGNRWEYWRENCCSCGARVYTHRWLPTRSLVGRTSRWCHGRRALSPLLPQLCRSHALRRADGGEFAEGRCAITSNGRSRTKARRCLAVALRPFRSCPEEFANDLPRAGRRHTMIMKELQLIGATS